MFNGECKIAAIWLYSKDPERAGEFYRNALQMKQIEHGDTQSFDGGGLRLSIHPLPKGKESPKGECFIVFFVKDSIQEKIDALRKRGVKVSDADNFPFGKIAEFKDPDGHDLYLWQPPAKSSDDYKDVSEIVEFSQGILAKLDA
jgi:predicted enzyme related to lactoylglutathione lyase